MDGPFSVGGVIIFTTVVLFHEPFSVVGVDVVDLVDRKDELLD